MNKEFKNPFTFKQWGFVAHIRNNIGKEQLKLELWKMYKGRHIMTLSQNELDRFINKMFLKYNLPEMYWIKSNAKLF